MAEKILVVDDDTNSIQVAESTLKGAGYEVVTMQDPKFVFKAIKMENPDLIISDIIMPHRDGYALCKEVKELYGDRIPVLLCTSKSYEEDLIETAYKEFGAEDYIIKPFNTDELLEKVEALLKEKKD